MQIQILNHHYLCPVITGKFCVGVPLNNQSIYHYLCHFYLAIVDHFNFSIFNSPVMTDFPKSREGSETITKTKPETTAVKG